MIRQQRRARVRLAQQRPAPIRVRARSRATAFRSLPWTTVGTAIGAIAAIGGLVFTGVATYYSAVVSRQQLDQVREDNALRERDQATRVSFWTETMPHDEGYESTTTVHVVNRSADPVSDIHLEFIVLDGGANGVLDISNVPPCSEVGYAASAINGDGRDGKTVTMSKLWWAPSTLTFTDRAGKLWVRSSTSLKPLKTFDGREFDYLATAIKPGSIKPLEQCDSGG